MVLVSRSLISRVIALLCLSVLASTQLIGDTAAESSAQPEFVLDGTTPLVVAGMGEGGGLARMLTTDNRVLGGAPFGDFRGGVRVATGDVNGDGVPDIVVGAGPGGGGVRVFSGIDATPLLNLAPFGATYGGGVFVAAGDINGDGRDDLVVGAGTGGMVRLLSAVGATDLGTGSPFGGAYTGGVTVAAGDLNGDGRADIITGMTLGGMVRAFDGATYAPMGSGFPYGTLHLGGVSVATGDVNNDGRDDVVVGALTGVAPGRVYNVADLRVLMTIPAFDADGMTVAAGDINSDGRADVIAGAGAGGGPHVRVFSGAAGNPVLLEAFAFDASFRGGVFVAGPNRIAVRFSSAAVTTFRTGNAGSFEVRTNGRGVTMSVVGTLPSGVTFTDRGDGTAALSGTPAAGTGGTYALTFRASRGSFVAASQTFTLTVQQPAAITSTAATAFMEEQAGTFSVVSSGFPTAALSVSGALPSGVTFADNGNGTATLSGTPAAATAGVYPLTIGATNPAGTATQNFSLTVNSARAQFTSAANTTLRVDSAGTFSITTSAIPTVTAITSTGTLPSGVTFTDNGNGTATLAGTPAVGTAGTHTLTLTATNGISLPATQTFTLNIQQAPGFTSAPTATFTRDAAGTFTITTNGLPIPSITQTGALPTGVSFVDNGNGTAMLAGTPTVSGPFALTFTAQNGVGSAATQAFTLTVQGPPVFTSATSTAFVVGAAGSFAVATSGTPAVTSLTLTGGTLPTGVTFTPGGATATLSGTPAAGTSGVYPLVLSASNGVGGIVTQNFTLTVNAVSAFTSAASTVFTAGAASTFTVTATGSPTPSITQTGTLPTGITFTDNGDGTATLSGTPAADSGGTYTLTFTASNGIGTAATQDFTLQVNNIVFTSASTVAFVVGQASSFTVTTTATPSVTSVARTGAALPNGVTFVDNGDGTATFAGTPAAGTAGSYVFTLTAQNGTSPSTQTFTLNVRQAPAITSANASTFTTGAAGSFTVTTTGSPAPSITRGGVALPSGVTFVDNGNGTATLAGTPAVGTGGSYALTFTAANAAGSVIQAFTLTVSAAPTFTSPANTTFTVGSPGTFTVTTVANPPPAITVVGALPAGVTFTDNADGTATLAGTPGPGTGNSYVLTFTADNGTGTPATQTFTLNVHQPPALTSAAATTFTVGVAGSFTVTTNGFPSPTIARGGVALPNGLTFVDNGNGTATLSGTPAAGTGGTYAMTFTADNGVAPAGTQSFTLTVNGPPSFTSATITTFTVGSPGVFTVTTVGSPVPALTSGALPAGLTFADHGDGTATLAGTPAAGTGGVHTLTFSAANGIAPNATQTFTLTINQAPAITSAAATTFTVGTAGSFTVTTSGFPLPTIASGGVALPAGVTFVDNGNGTGTLSGTPAAGTVGTYAITFTATNPAGSTPAQAFTLTVVGGSLFTSAPTTTFTVGVPGSFTVTATGTPAPAITLSGGTLPLGVTFVDNGGGSGTLSGTPAAGTGGVYALTFTASNGLGPDSTQAFTLNVNEAPAITSAGGATFLAGAPGSFTVTTSGFPPPALIRAGTPPSGVTFVDNGNGTGTLSGTPAAASGGIYTLSFVAQNSVSASPPQTFALTVNQAPIVTSANTTSFSVGVPGSFTVTATGFPPPAITLTGGTLPSGLTFAAGLLSGMPAGGSAGPHPLTFTIANAAGSVTQNFTLNILEGPVITSAPSATFTLGAPNSFTVTASGFLPPALVQGGTLPAGVTWVDNGDGSGTLSGTPQAGTGGVYPLTFTAANASGAAVQNFTLAVSQPPAFTSANTTTFTVGAAGTFTVTTSGAPTAALTVVGVLPGGMTFLDNGNGTGTLSGTPAAGTGGAYPLTFTAANGTLPNATQPFTLNVNQAPAITSAANATFSVGVPGTFTVTTSAFPPPTIARGGVALPNGVTFVDNGNGTGTLSGTPAAGMGGTYAISFTATNVAGASPAQPFTLTVRQAPAITSANTTDFRIGVAGSFTVTTAGFPVPSIARGGVALPAGVAFVDNGNGTGTLSGTPAVGSAATYAISFTATNIVGSSPVQAFTLNVQQPPAITSANSTTFTVGVASSFTVTTTGFPVPTLSQTGMLPAGVTFTTATRVLGGTATQTGSFPIQFTATNGVPPDATQNFTLNAACPAISVNPATMPEGLFQTAYGPVTFSQTGSTGGTITWTATGLPAGLTIAGTTGIVSGTPTTTVLNGAVAITATDNFGCAGTRNTTITVRPVADNENYTGGAGNTQYVVGAAVPLTPHVLNADVNNTNVKMGDNGPGTLSVTFPGTTANGGTIAEGTVDGTFIYTPPVGFAGATDTFTYTLTDGNTVTNTATVTINRSGMVWYVNSSAVSNGDGRSHNPFNALNNAGTPSLTNQMIYVHTGGATTAGNITLDANQTLHGNGAIFTLAGTGLMIAAGARPTLTGTVTLANNNAVTAVNFTPSGIPAMTGTGLTGPVAIDQVNVTGGTNALSLSNVSGAVTVSNATFTNTTGAELLISGGTGAVTINPTVTISSNAGRSIDIQGRTTAGSGAVTISGPVADTSGGIFLDNNDGSSIIFRGGLTLSTGASPAFTATNGGTVEVCDENPCAAAATGPLVNTITTTTGTALNVANTTIGGTGLTFRSISANGATNGIVLNNTGTTAGLTLAGNGSACTSAATCTGGAILNTTGDGLALTNTRTVSLTRLFVGAAGNHGINATTVNGLTLNNARIQDAGNADNEHGLNLVNATGTVTIDATAFSGASEDLVHLENNNTNVTFNVLNNSQFSYPASIGGLANSAILLLPGGTAAVTASIQNSTFTNIRNLSAQISANLLNSNGTQNFTFSNNTISVTIAGRSGGVFVGGQELSTTNMTIANNTFNGAGGNGVISIDTNDTSRVQGTVSGNQITNPPGIGMFVAVDEAATNDIVFDNNTITNSGGDGVQAVNFGGAGVSTMQLALTNNVVSGHSANTAVNFVGGISFTGFEDSSCVVLRGNSVTGTPTGPAQCGGAPCVDYYLEEVGGATTLEEVPNTAATTANAAYVNSINDAGPVTVFGVIDLTNGATCNVAMMAAAGERPVRRPAEVLDQTHLPALLSAAGHGVESPGPSPTGEARSTPTVPPLGLYFTDLAAGQLGRLAGGHIAIDRDAAGWGWFIDPTPDQDEEFEPAFPGSRELRAKAGGPADGKMDLLTVLRHEAGHARGEADVDPVVDPEAVMAAKLNVGVRRSLPPDRRR